MRILLLGGTAEGSAMARALAAAGVAGVYSYAGRTGTPAPQPLPLRVGGFGGAEGLAAWLRAEGISHVIDATHPFAATISRNAVAACAAVGVPLIALQRPAWQAVEGDLWHRVASIEAAAAALPDAPATVFLAIGRQSLAPFAAHPRHRYVLRFVDPWDGPPPLPGATVIVDRGPFGIAGDTALMRQHGVTHVVAKNAGGQGAAAKLAAARALRLPVIMVDRPEAPPRRTAGTVGEVMDWLAHGATRRGV